MIVNKLHLIKHLDIVHLLVINLYLTIILNFS